ncbi:hypothetical protein ABQE69_14895 [Mycolicibacillus trivialis]
MFGVWEYGPAFLEGAQPYAVSESQSKLEDWADTNNHIPRRGGFRLFFVESADSAQRWSDTDLRVVGHRYRAGVRFNGRPQQAAKYIARRRNAMAQGCPALSDSERVRQPINIDEQNR